MLASGTRSLYSQAILQFAAHSPRTGLRGQQVVFMHAPSPEPLATDGQLPETDNRLAILQEITLALNSTLDPGKLLDLLLDSCIRYTGATTGSVALVTDVDELDIVAQRGLGADVRQRVRLKIGEGITGWVAQSGKPLCVADVTRDERYVKIKEHIRSELAVPMMRRNRVIGVISVDSTRQGNFSAYDEEILSFVGSQAAQVLENANAFDALQRKARLDEALLELSQVLSSALDLESLFEQVMRILSAHGGMHRGCLVLIDSKSPDELAIAYAHGMTSEQMARGRYHRGEGIIGEVYLSKQPIGVRDIHKEPRFLWRTGAQFEPNREVSFFAVPILLEGEAVGVLGVMKDFPGEEAFATDLSFLQIVSGTLSQAVKIYQSAERDKADLKQENLILRENLRTKYNFGQIVGNSLAMENVFRTVVSVASKRATVLIRGESGTGKELIAHAIHYNSPRANRPFVRVNSAAIPEALLEAELFGHTKGSFTGAISDRKGKFALADGGTIFLDEIGDMSPVLQAKILRVLQDREVDAVGADQSFKVDVRIIAATHQPLEDLVREGKFREDLYYRLNVVQIDVPPLRERSEDIRVLVQHFLDKLRGESESVPTRVSTEALRQLMLYDWPGNVRELQNTIERAAILCESDVIQPRDLPVLGGPSRIDRTKPPSAEPQPVDFEELVRRHSESALEHSAAGSVWDETIRTVERALIRSALQRVHGIRLKAAEVLGIHRNTLRKKIEELGM
jgi:Nif-specific regulatory protein